MEQRALEGLLLLPADPRALYYGKALANCAAAHAAGRRPRAGDGGALRCRDGRASPALLGVIVLGAAGLSAPGTLYAAMTAQARARNTLLPLLLFPLVVPVLLAAVKATSLLILGDPMGQLRLVDAAARGVRRDLLVAVRPAVRARGRGLSETRCGNGRVAVRESSGFGLALLAWGSTWGLFFAPRETYMGDVQRIMYVHVPTAWNAMLVLTFAFGCALVSLLRGGWTWDARLEAAIEVGVVLSGARSACRARSGREPTWGVWWDWDPRLTTTAVLVFAFGGILALRQFVDDPSSAPSGRRWPRSIAYVDVPHRLLLGALVELAAPAAVDARRPCRARSTGRCASTPSACCS